MADGEQNDNDIDWGLALTLGERKRLAAHGRIPPGSKSERRLARWRRRKPLDDDAWFQRRLAQAGIDRASVAQLLEPSVEWSRLAPRELTHLRVTEHRLREVPDIEPARIQEHVANEQPFLVVAEPLIQEAMDRLDALCRDMPAQRLDAERIQAGLRQRLHRVVNGRLTRAAVLELNIARLEERLHGGTPEARFRAFIDELATRDGRIGFFAEYPVLLRQLVQRIEDWLEGLTELLGRLRVDWDELAERFGTQGSLAPVVAIEEGLGDPHRHCRSVSILEHADGARVVYKPRPLAADRAFQELLAWVNRRLDGPELRAIEIFDRGEYGWVEHVAAEACDGRDAVARFYWRMGALLALAYALHASDLHYGNVMAAGEHPVLIDLETLMHPELASRSTEQADALPGAVAPATITLSGLVPELIWGSEDRPGVDLSALGADEGQELPTQRSVPVAQGSDEMRLQPQTAYVEGGEHRPRIDGTPTDGGAFRTDVLVGFETCYRMLARHAEDLLARHGPIDGFRGARLRRILRPTRVYSALLEDAFHPDFLGDAAERALHWEGLWEQVPPQPWLARVVDDEIQQLERGDIPYFWVSFDGCDAISATGRRFVAMFRHTPCTLARERIRSMGEQDLRAQRWLLDASLRRLVRDSGSSGPRGHKSAAPRSATPSELIDTARGIGEHLAGLAVRWDDYAAWVCPVMARFEGVSTFSTAVDDLYHGNLGIALFLAYLARVTGETRYGDLARASAFTAVERRRIAEGENTLGIGAFVGDAGYGYALAHLGTLLDEPDLVTECKACFEAITDRVADEEGYTVLEGAAGVIIAADGLAHALELDAPTRVRRACAERLAAIVRCNGDEATWPGAGGDLAHLTGFSHGSAGFSCALMIAAAREHSSSYRELARAAWRYENRRYDFERDNWPDYREVAADNAGGMLAWCHGAPGIGLARLTMFPHLVEADRAAAEADIRTALRVTSERGLGLGHCLCHGDLGNLDILAQGARWLGDERLTQQVATGAAAAIDRARHNGWHCGLGSSHGLAPGQELPGLMLGLAGVGLGLLRLAQPAAVPSVLSLAPPVSA